MKRACTITRIYITPSGQRGVCYVIGREKKATFIPKHVRISGVHFWLARSLGVDVNLPDATIQRLDVRWLTSLVGEVRNTRALAQFEREDITSLRRCERGIIATMMSQRDEETTYSVTLDTEQRGAQCTCPDHTYRKRVCKHIGHVAKSLLSHANLKRPSTPCIPHAKHDTTAQGRWYALEESTPGFISIEGSTRTVWLMSQDIVVLRSRTTSAGIQIQIEALDERAARALPAPITSPEEEATRPHAQHQAA